MLGDIKHFMGRVMAITPNRGDFMGGGGEGVQDISEQLVYRLREAAVRFAQAYVGGKTDFKDLQKLAADVEDRLLTAATVMRFPAERTDGLVNELHILVAVKAVQS